MVLARSTRRVTARRAPIVSFHIMNNLPSLPSSSHLKQRALPQKLKLNLSPAINVEVEARAMQSRQRKRSLIIRIRRQLALSISQRPLPTTERSLQSAYYNLTWNQNCTIFNTFQITIYCQSTLGEGAQTPSSWFTIQPRHLHNLSQSYDA